MTDAGVDGTRGAQVSGAASAWTPPYLGESFWSTAGISLGAVVGLIVAALVAEERGAALAVVGGCVGRARHPVAASRRRGSGGAVPASLAAITLACLVTGGPASPLTHLFVLPVVYVALTKPRRTIIVVTSLALTIRLLLVVPVTATSDVVGGGRRGAGVVAPRGHELRPAELPRRSPPHSSTGSRDSTRRWSRGTATPSTSSIPTGRFLEVNAAAEALSGYAARRSSGRASSRSSRRSFARTPGGTSSEALDGAPADLRDGDRAGRRPARTAARHQRPHPARWRDDRGLRLRGRPLRGAARPSRARDLRAALPPAHRQRLRRHLHRPHRRWRAPLRLREPRDGVVDRRPRRALVHAIRTSPPTTCRGRSCSGSATCTSRGMPWTGPDRDPVAARRRRAALAGAARGRLRGRRGRDRRGPGHRPRHHRPRASPGGDEHRARGASRPRRSTCGGSTR